jgi:folate-binding protein YgfZ
MAERIAHENGRPGAALADRSARGRIVASGADRRSYLHAMLTNDIASLGAGRGCYAAYLTPQGRMIADMRVLDLGDVLLLDVDGGVTSALLEKLDQFVFSEDVRFGDVTDAFCSFALFGARSAGVLADVLRQSDAAEPRAELDHLDEFANFRAAFRGDVLIVAASREMAARGFDLYIDRQSADGLRRALIEAGATEIDSEATEVARIERGRPLYPVDMDGETIPLEAGIEHRAISFTKGCYPGQEVITRVLHRGHGRVVRKLVGLVADGSVAPSPDVAVTSAAVSPVLGRPIALAYLHRDYLAPGTAVEVVHHGVGVPATVTDLPFVKD